MGASLGWPEEVTLRTSMPYIEMAIEERDKSMRAMYGGDEPDTQAVQVQTRPMTPELFDALFQKER